MRDVLDALDLRRVHLVGTSMGGWLALSLAARSPAGIASVALLDPAQTLARIPPRTMLRSIGATPLAPAPLRRRFLAALGGGPVPDDDPVVQVIEQSMRAWSEALPMPTFPSERTLRSVRVPVLALLGGRSTILDADRARARAQAHLPDVRVEVWPQASHALPGEYPAETGERLIAHAAAADAAAAVR